MTDKLKRLKKKNKVEEFRNEVDEAKERAMYKFYEKRRLRKEKKYESKKFNRL